MSSYFNPVRIVKTDDWFRELNFSIDALKMSSPIIVTSKGNRKRLNLDKKFNSDSIYSKVSINPNFEDCNNALKFCKKNNMFDGVIAIGGGSAMDLAKVVMAHLSTKKSDIHELIELKDKFPKPLPSIFLPTTHGTASEVTMWGTIWDMKEKKKYSISNPALYPSIAILDGFLTLTLPLDISIITVMDALSHSFEAIWNKNANDKSTNYAIDAITIILKNVNFLKQNSTDLTVRNKLLKASNLAGLAFSNTATAAAHSISYPLTINYAIPHGVASSLPLLPLLQINKSAIEKELKLIMKKLKMSHFSELQNCIKEIPKNIVKFNLKSWGVTQSDLSVLVEQSFTKGRMENNIIDLSKNDVLSILKYIFKDKDVYN